MARRILDKLFSVIGTDHPQAVEQQRIRRYKGDGFDYLLTNNPDEMRRSDGARFSGRKERHRKTFSESQTDRPVL